MLELVRQELSTLQPYQPGRIDCKVRLDANESPFDLPAELKDQVLSWLRDLGLNRYPEQLRLQLQSKLAEMVGLQAQNAVLGNGSDELILMVSLAFCMGRRVFIPTPTFSMYRQAALIAGAEPVEVPLADGFRLDVDRIKQAAVDQLGVLFICNPNNPSGNLQNQQDILRLLHETDLLVVVDEAYGEFAGVSSVPLLGRGLRLIVLRTMSKAFSLAGARVGYAIADSSICLELERVRQPYNLDTMALVAAITAIDNRQYVESYVAGISAERERVFARLQALSGIEPFSSSTNFILFRVGQQAADIHRKLQERGILIRKYDGALADCLRVSIGTRTENDVFMVALRDILAAGQEGGVDDAHG